MRVESAFKYKGGASSLASHRFMDFTRALETIIPTASLESARKSTMSYEGSTLPASSLLKSRTLFVMSAWCEAQTATLDYACGKLSVGVLELQNTYNKLPRICDQITNCFDSRNARRARFRGFTSLISVSVRGSIWCTLDSRAADLHAFCQGI